MSNFHETDAYLADPGDRAVERVGLRPFACWDCWFKSHRRQGCLSLAEVSDGPIPRPEESCRVCHVTECNQVQETLSAYSE